MSQYDPIISVLLREARKQTVGKALEALIEKEINISPGIRTKAQDSQKHLRDFLSSERGRDSSFPRVLSIADKDFLGGSFARHTKIWPLDDIDIYIPLDGFGLVYFEQGVVTSNKVVTDNVLQSNPLLSMRWGDSHTISSDKLITEFAKVLRRHYPDATDVYPNGEAVSVRMTIGATEESDGLGYDIVPCFCLSPYTLGSDNFYLMPDGNNGWLKTNPRLDTERTESLHKSNNKTFRKVVKLIKYWNSQLQEPFGSYYIELAVGNAYSQHASAVSSLSFGLALGFYGLLQAVKSGDLFSQVPGALPVKPGTDSVATRSRLADAQKVSKVAWDSEKADRIDEALTAWKSIFGDAFKKDE